MILRKSNIFSKRSLMIDYVVACLPASATLLIEFSFQLNKPLMERRRRQRINNCLDELKTILETLSKNEVRANIDDDKQYIQKHATSGHQVTRRDVTDRV